MKKILITGGNGFLGSNTVRQFIHMGYQVMVLVKKSDSSMVKTAQLPDVSNSQSQLSTSSKKFRFVSGPQGNSANSKKISIKKVKQH